MKQPKFYILLAALALIGYGSGIAYAMDNDGMEDMAQYQQLKHAKISLVEAVQKAEEASPDMTVSSVEFEEENEQPAYSIELLSENGEKEITINAATGEIISENY